ncbi:hypothetical protein PG987_004349 [Apiospora arundinis]
MPLLANLAWFGNLVTPAFRSAGDFQEVANGRKRSEVGKHETNKRGCVVTELASSDDESASEISNTV